VCGNVIIKEEATPKGREQHLRVRGRYFTSVFSVPLLKVLM